MMPRLIALSAYAQAGKDTLGGVIADQYEHTPVGFADALRAVLYALNPLVHGPADGRGHMDVPWLWEVQELVDAHGWEFAKANSGVRAYLQRLGTEGGRKCISDTVWVDTLMAKVAHRGAWVITDCRFPNEADAVTRAGGVVWRINREGVAPTNPHPSETALDDYPFDRVFNVPTLPSASSARVWYARQLAAL